MVRKRVGSRTVRQREEKLQELEAIKVNEGTPAQKTKARTLSVKLIRTLGFDQMAKDVVNRDATAADTLRFISNMKGLSDQRRRIAAVAAWQPNTDSFTEITKRHRNHRKSWAATAGAGPAPADQAPLKANSFCDFCASL